MFRTPWASPGVYVECGISLAGALTITHSMLIALEERGKGAPVFGELVSSCWI